ncbi:MAG TPA: hypothetical protein VNL73_11455 [Verrucomicrobiae bacterium]|nr:hypothetical protein [Verrucomicrobiae bacterium]
MQKRPGGSLLVRSSGAVRLLLIFFVAAVNAGIVLEGPKSFTRIFFGLLVALLPLGIAAILDSVRFEFDGMKRRLFWRRKNLFRTRTGEMGFDEITEVRLASLSDPERRKGKNQQCYRVVLATAAGDLPLSNVWTSNLRKETQIAEGICALLGKGSPVTVESSVDELVAAGQKIDAIKLARERFGLNLTQAKKLIDEKSRLKSS